MNWFKRLAIVAGLMSFGGIVTMVANYAANPPVADVVINGHTYSNAMLEANPAGWISGIANDVGAITSLYPRGRFTPRVALTSDLTMYADPNGSDNNNCLVGNPCRTVQRIFDLLRDSYDFQGWVVTVQLAAGTYSTGLTVRGRMVGQQSPASLILQGNSSSPQLVVVEDLTVPTGFYETGTGTAIYGNWGAMLTVDGMQVIGGFRDIWANSESEIRIKNIIFGSSGTTATHLAASHAASVRVRGNYSVIGGATRSHALGTDYGAVMLSDVTTPEINPVITFVGNPSVGKTLEAQRHGEIVSQSSQTTFVGTVVGKKFDLDMLGLLWTNGSGGTNYIPGTIGGTATNGAVFN